MRPVVKGEEHYFFISVDTPYIRRENLFNKPRNSYEVFVHSTKIKSKKQDVRIEIKNPSPDTRLLTYLLLLRHG